MIFDAMFNFLQDEDMYISSATKFEGTTSSTLDWVSTGLEMGAGEPLYMNVRVGTTAWAGGTSAQAIVTTDAVKAGHDSSSTEIMRGPVVLVAAATPGKFLMRQALPYNCDFSQYLAVGIVSDGANTAGNIDAWIDHGPQSDFDTQVATSNI